MTIDVHRQRCQDKDKKLKFLLTQTHNLQEAEEKEEVEDEMIARNSQEVDGKLNKILIIMTIEISLKNATRRKNITKLELLLKDPSHKTKKASSMLKLIKKELGEVKLPNSKPVLGLPKMPLVAMAKNKKKN